MKYFVYILYSESLNRYYIGSTILEVSERLERHIEDYYGKTKFTHKVRDWEIFLTMKCNSLQQARKIEFHIKRMKSKVYIENLLKYPEISEKLLRKYHSDFTQD